MINANLLTARDIMTTKLITLRPETPIFDAITTLIRNRISGAPVLDSDGKLCGIISERDCTKILAESTYDHHEADEMLSVSGNMTTDVITLRPDTGVYKIVTMFDKHRVRRFPVLDNGKLVGQVSRRDVLKGILRMEDEITKYLAHPLPRDHRSPKLWVSATRHDPSEVARKLK